MKKVDISQGDSELARPVAAAGSGAGNGNPGAAKSGQDLCGDEGGTASRTGAEPDGSYSSGRPAGIEGQPTPAGASAVERLFNEHNESLLRFLRLRLRSDEEAREVAQEAYVRLLQLDHPEAVSYFRAFLFKTATNIAIDRLRRDTLDQRKLTLDFFEQAVPSAEHTETQLDLLRQVAQCLEELPPKCRKAFLLSRVYGVSTSDIAAQMRLTPRMIRLYLVRATVHCQVRLNESGGRGELDED